MSVRVENYLIYGIKLGCEFTKDFWKQDFYDDECWCRGKAEKEPYFLTDGMNGGYTFFGFITELSDGFDEPEEKEISLFFTDAEIIQKFYKLYPNEKINDGDIKLFYLPHWV